MPSSESIIRQNPIMLAFQMLVMNMLFNFVYVVLSFIADTFETFDKGELANTITYDSAAYILLMVLEFCLLLWMILRWYHKTYFIEANYLVRRSGILFKNEMRFALNNFESISVHQGFLGRIFQYGTIQISNPTQNQKITLYAVANPQEFVHWLKKMEAKN